MNAESEMVTSVSVTGRDAHHGKQSPGLAHKDPEQGLPPEIHTADRGYDDAENHSLLETYGMHSAIIPNDYRTQKRDADRAVRIHRWNTTQYKEGLEELYRIER